VATKAKGDRCTIVLVKIRLWNPVVGKAVHGGNEHRVWPDTKFDDGHRWMSR
jgi:hypothetical protein